MSNCLLIILPICSRATFWGFPSKYSKSCFHKSIRSCWLVAFSLAFAVLFLLLTSFTVCQTILECLFLTKSLILSIWLCMYSDCSFGYFSANSFLLFYVLGHWYRLGSFYCIWRQFYTSVHFSLTSNVSHGTLGLGFCLVGLYSAAASKWSLKKFSYSSFGVCASVFSCSASNLFLSVNAYLSLIWLFLSRDRS